MKFARWSCCALLLLSGCSSISDWVNGKNNVEVPARLEEFTAQARFEVRWKADLGDGGTAWFKPALSDNAVFGVSSSGRLTRLARSSGKVVWQVETGSNISAGVGRGDGFLVLGSDKGEVLAYDDDGKLRWKAKVSSEVLATPQVEGNVVLVRSGDGRIVALSATDGKQLWFYERATPALVVRSHAGMVVQRGTVFAGFAGGKLAAISIKDGAVLWEANVSQPRGNTELERISDITSDPVVDDEQVCAISFQGRLGCFDVSQGSTLWTRDMTGEKGLMLLRKYLYLTDVKGVVLALDKTSGATLWRNDQLKLRQGSKPYTYGDHTLVGDFEGYLHAMSREDGHFQARIQLDDAPITLPPQEMDQGLLVQTQRGEVYSLSLH